MDIPGDLVKKIADGNCVVFVGSGLSIAAGLPGWPDLLRQMIRWAEEHGKEMSDRADLEKDIDNNKLLDVAEEMRERLGENDFRQFMVEVFCNPDLGPVEAHELLTEIPFSAVITSNYDTFVEDTWIRKGSSSLVFTQLDYPELAGALRDDKFYVLKVQGTINRMETIILGRSDYREVMFSNPAYQQHLATLFSTKTVLFLGFALTDPDLMTLMDKLGAIFKGYGGKHYALMHVKEVPPYRQNRFERDYNIHIIPYDDHSEVPVFLRELVQELGKPEREEGEKKAIPTPGGAIGVPDLPEYFLERPDYLDRIRSSVLAGAGKPVGITGTGRIGLYGMGGIGKSVLAAALARDEGVLKAFPDGVIWLIISQEPNIIARQRQVAQAIGEEPPHFDDEQQGRAYLSKILADKACLLILDDVWKSQHVANFDALGKGCRMLITTRNAGILPPGTVNHCLDVMEDDEAMELLARAAGISQSELPDVAKEVAEECGNLPLALAMIGSMARGKPDQWDAALHRLRNADLEKIKRDFPNYAYPDLMRAIQVGVDALEGIRERYLDFAVFPEDIPIPEAVLETFWKPEGLDIYDTRDVVNELIDRSLLRSDNRGWLNLHDLQFDYVRKQACGLPALHNRLLDAYAEQCKDGWHTGPDDGYFFQYLPYHLKEAGRGEELRELLLDFNWLQAKLDATDINALMDDYTAEADEDLQLVRRAIRMSAYVLAQDPTQLAGQLLGRMLSQESPRIQSMLKQAAQYKACPCLLPTTSCLTPPGDPLVFTLKGHTGYVLSVTVTPDSRFAISGSADKTLKVWDLETGVEVRTLKGHKNFAHAVTVTPDSRFAVFGSDDNTLKVWDLETGAEVRTLKGHTDWVWSVTVTPDSRFIISGSWDNTLKVWDLETGMEVRTLEGHTDSVRSVTVTPDSRFAISGSVDKTLRVWDLETGVEVRTLKGHTDSVHAVIVTPDSRFAISGEGGPWGGDTPLKVWDLETGVEVRTLKGHTGYVHAVTVTPDSRFAISGSGDKTLKVWDLEIEKVGTLKGHTGWVSSVAVTPDSRFAISGSRDNTLRVWDLKTGEEVRTLKGHTGYVYAVTVTPDSRFAISGSVDKTLRVWDLETGQEVRTLVGHTGSVYAVTVTPDSRFAISGSRDKTLRVWDLETGVEVRTLKRHAGYIYAVTVTPDSRFVISGSGDGTLKVWDLETGMEVRTLKEHTRTVRSVTVTPDSRFVISGSGDKTLKVWEWDLETGVEVRTLKGHASVVNAVTVTPDSRFAISGSSDDILKVWDLETGEMVASFTTEDSLHACAVAPDGKTIVAGGATGQVYFLRLEGL
jgi:WD40 repeat protein